MTLKMKIAFNNFISRLDTAEERIDYLKEKSIEITHMKTQGEKKGKRMEHPRVMA